MRAFTERYCSITCSPEHIWMHSSTSPLHSSLSLYQASHTHLDLAYANRCIPRHALRKAFRMRTNLINVSTIQQVSLLGCIFCTTQPHEPHTMTVPCPYKIPIMEPMHVNKPGWLTRRFTLLQHLIRFMFVYIDSLCLSTIHVLEESGRKRCSVS